MALAQDAPNAKYLNRSSHTMGKKKILTAEERKRLLQLANEGLKPLYNEEVTAEQLEQVRLSLDEIITITDSAESLLRGRKE